jgi:riboflavin kinase/FMN adenylyltransferase
MIFRQQLASAAPQRDSVVTIGVFDGVHQGHCHLLRRLVHLAQPNYLPAVVTFTNHPITVLRPQVSMSYITSPAEKERLLRQQGVELVVSLEFTPELAQVGARDFTLELVEKLRLKGLVVGPDFSLGHDREGNAPFLRTLGAELGFWVDTVEPMVLEGGSVRSRRVRELVRQGDVGAAARLLGRWFSLQGEVVTGNRRGRQLGFPTANVEIPPLMLLPGDGVYATWVTVQGRRPDPSAPLRTWVDEGVRRPAATSIGVRPTFGLSRRLVEVYIMDFSGDLYGQELRVEFVAKVRDQASFPNVAALVAQMQGDVADARQVLARPACPELPRTGGAGLA